MNRKGLILLLTAVVFALPLLAQGRKNMRINEVMVQADSMAPGCHAGWVELYNSSYGTNAIEKMFITTLKADEIFGANTDEDKDVTMRRLAVECPGKMYEIPRGDERNTKISPRSHVVFYADGDSTAGTFHLPFVLTLGTENYIALYDVNGELVDEVTVPATLEAGSSYAVKSEGRLPIAGVNADAWEVRNGKTKATAITQGNFNTRESNNNIEDFHIHDPHGFAIALLAMLVVFSALILLYICFKLFGKVSQSKVTDPAVASPAAALSAADSDENKGGDDEVIAAIAMALYQHLNAHDSESGVLTFNRDTHTAWSSKAAMMRQLPERR